MKKQTVQQIVCAVISLIIVIAAYAFVVGGGHLLVSEDDGVLLSILHGFGSDDVGGVVVDGHFAGLHFGSHVAAPVVFVATGAEEG